MTKAQQADKAEAIARLRDWIKPGDTVYTILEHVSRSGMQREIRVVLPTVECREVYHDNAIGGYTENVHTVGFLHPNHAISKALGLRQGKRDGLILGGCGMDMGFHLVYELSATLYGTLRCPHCGTYDHRADHGVGKGTPTCTDCGGPLIGGYACLGKGKCPSNYHNNHHDTVQCEGTRVYNPDGADTGQRCFWSSEARAWVLSTGDETVKRCPVCKGKGRIPNLDGPERFDLLHTDGYAIRHRWL